MLDQAHARRSDPETSHAAAAAVTQRLTAIQRRVEAYAFGKGPSGFCDAEMADDLEDSSSTLRTRRSELVQRGILAPSGASRRWGSSPHARVVWVHRAFHPNPPEICPKAARPTRQQALELAMNLDLHAGMYEGMTKLWLRKAAEMIRALA